MSNSIVAFALSEIRNDNGLFSLNDLHAAAGGEKKHQPNNFLRNQQIIDLISYLKSEESPTLISKQGLGTFVCKELVIAYAAWISPIFHLRVLRTFLNSQAPAAYLTDEQLAHIKYGVRLKVLASGKSWQAVYRELFEHVQAPSVREIKAERFSDACRFLGISTSLRGITEKDLVPVDALPAPADVALIPFGLKKDATYMVWVRDGKARRRELLFGELFGDRRQEWCADSVGDW